MKKNAYTVSGLILLIALFTLGCSKGKKKENDLIKEGLVGDVKTVTQLSFDVNVKFGEAKKGKRTGYNIETSFDEKGNMLSRSVFWEDGSLAGKKNCKHDKEGNLIEEVKYGSNGKLENKLTYKYDEKGNIIEKVSFNGDGVVENKKTFKYNEKGGKIEEAYYGGDGTPGKKLTYKYDDKGNIIEEVSFKGNDELQYKTIYKHDKEGNVIEEKHLGNEGKIVNRHSYKHDKEGNVIEEMYYHRERLYNKIIFAYDEKGNLIEKVTYGGDEKLEKRTTHKYDEKGSLLLTQEFNGTGKIITECTYTYEYDEKGNWVKKSAVVPFKVGSGVWERKIVYFSDDDSKGKPLAEENKEVKSKKEESPFWGKLVGKWKTKTDNGGSETVEFFSEGTLSVNSTNSRGKPGETAAGSYKIIDKERGKIRIDVRALIAVTMIVTIKIKDDKMYWTDQKGETSEYIKIE